MKRLLIFFIITICTGGYSVFSDNITTTEDSVFTVLNSMPNDSSRLNMLYTIAYKDPMSPSCIRYISKLLDEATKQNNKKYQCLATYAHVTYYFNHQDEENTVIWMEKLSKLALDNKFYNLYFTGKRAEITIRIINRKIEYSITEAEKMYELARKLGNTGGMSSAKLCLMTAYLVSARYKEGFDAGFESYSLLPSNTPLETRYNVLQEIVLACSSANSKSLLKYMQEFENVLTELSSKNKLNTYKGGYLLLESLYADHYLDEGNMVEARKHLNEMNKYLTPTSYIPYRGLYYNVYSRYYRISKEYEKSLAYSDTAINLLSGVSDNDGINYRIERAGILAEAERLDEAIPLYQNLLAKKDSFYRELSVSQMDEIHHMHHINELYLEKEHYGTIFNYIVSALIAIALIVLVPITIRIYNTRKKLTKEEKEIRRMSRIAEEANEVKNRFLANMSYSIRVPLNNVLGFSQLMAVDPESMNESQWKEYSEIIQANSAELIQLVNNVLDLSRLEAGKTKWQIQEYDIIALCTDIVHMAQMKSENRININFHTEIASQFIRIDISRFTEVLLSTLTYADPCEIRRNISFFLEHDKPKELLVFRIINSPLADPELQTQKVEVLHSINRLTIEHFGGTYTIEPVVFQYPAIIFTYSYTHIK